MTAEREIKLDVPADFEMPDIACAATGIDVVEGGTVTYETTWFDTPDLRLARWGASLRFRDGEGWTLKLDPSTRAGVLTRAELRFDGGAGTVPGRAADLVRAFARGVALEPRVRATTTRHRHELRASDRPVVELVDDAVEVTDAPPGASRFRQIELELRDDEHAADVARDVARALRSAGAPHDDGRPKMERALGGTPVPEIVVPRVKKGSAIGDLIRAALAGPVLALVARDPWMRLAADPEDVHKARVATRRLRSNLRMFSGWLDPGWATDLRTQVGRLADDLGAVRDADVMSARLREQVEALDDDDRTAGAALMDRVAAGRAEAGDRLAASMSSDWYERLVDRLVSAAREPALRGATEVPVDAVGSVVEVSWTKLRRAVERTDGSADPDALHRVRIRAKRMRYAAEAVQPAFGGRAKRFARLAADLQDVLGEHHDAVVLERWLREVASKAEAEEAFVAGQVAARQRRAGLVAAAAWPDAWRSLSRKRNVFWS